MIFEETVRLLNREELEVLKKLQFLKKSLPLKVQKNWKLK